MSDPLSWLRAPCVMGILNATPDSLWGGSGALDPREALARLAHIADDGAAICDVGAESTRPGARPGQRRARSSRASTACCGRCASSRRRSRSRSTPPWPPVAAAASTPAR